MWSIWCAPSSNHCLDGLCLVALKCLLFGIVAYCLFGMEVQKAVLNECDVLLLIQHKF
ncbi:hypothetical protein [Enterococcus termitis]|uniref:hypothetical protein n=1 Tax=Enterococcus termitis TaxID=332950 RepID=UPI003CCC0401